MSPTIPNNTTEGRIYNDLRNLANRSGRDPSEYYILYALEGFLVRLAQSEMCEDLVLKGGVLMSAYSQRRPTRDIDLSAKGFSGDVTTCENRMRSIVEIPCDDGLVFDSDRIKGEAIRDESAYSGTRVNVVCQLASATLHFHIDLNFGDPINPYPTSTSLPLLLGGEIEVLAYPLTMVLAEKIVTAVDRGIANTRWRDFLDIARISNTQIISGSELSGALETIGVYRGVGLKPLSGVLEDMGDIAQSRWETWRRKQRLKEDSPEKFGELLDRVFAFSDAALEGTVSGKKWDPGAIKWV